MPKYDVQLYEIHCLYYTVMAESAEQAKQKVLKDRNEYGELPVCGDYDCTIDSEFLTDVALGGQDYLQNHYAPKATLSED